MANPSVSMVRCGMMGQNPTWSQGLALPMIHHWPIACLLFAGALDAQQRATETLPVVAVPQGEIPAAPFLALARERGPVPRPDHGDMQATIWSIDPVLRTAERRVVLGASQWAATPLLDSPRLLRWQTPDRGKRWRLLRLDPASFEVEELLAASRLSPLGRGGDRIYVQADGGQFFVHDAEGGPTAVQPGLQVVAQHGDDWLLAVDGTLARFDAASGRVVRRHGKIAASAEPTRPTAAQWDGGRFVVWLGRFFDQDDEPIEALPFGRAAIVRRELRVVDLDAETSTTVKVRTQARGGSGQGVLPRPLHLELVGGLLRYAERKPAAGDSADLERFEESRDLEWVTIDIATGKELLRAPYEPRPAPEVEPPPAERVPEYLRQGVAASPVRAWGLDQDLAYAFLVDKAVDVALPQRGVVKFDAVVRTAEGNRLLVLHRGWFHLCDLVRKEHTKWPAPAAVAQADVELHELR